MARLSNVKETKPIQVTKFLGLNLDPAGETQLDIGESPDMINMRITDRYKLQKRYGQTQLFESLGAGNVRGATYIELNDILYLIFSHGGTLYRNDLVGGGNEVVGAITDADIDFVAMNDKLYMFNGTDYKEYDGTTYQDTVPKIPKTAISKNPDGTGGGEGDETNLLTDAETEGFVGDGVATLYVLDKQDLTSVDTVIVDGVTLSDPADYSVDLVNGTVTFVVAPSDGAALEDDNVLITYSKADTGDPDKVKKCRGAILFGGDNDTTVFIWGNPEFRNRRIYSAILDPTYFPTLNFTDIGSDFNTITAIAKIQEQQLIYTEEDNFYSRAEVVAGSLEYPVFNLNARLGCVAFNQAVNVNNDVLVPFEGVYRWFESAITAKNDPELISQRIQPDLDNLDLTQVRCFNWIKEKEYWLAADGFVWVWNYKNNTFYKYDNFNITCYVVIDQELYFGTTDGRIVKVDRNSRSDDGNDIALRWTSGFDEFGIDYLQKYSNRLWLSLKPEDKSSVDITYRTNDTTSSAPITAEYNLATFLNMDFADFSFLTSRNPQPFRFKIKAKKWTFLQIELSNTSKDETLTIIGLTIKIVTQGESK